MFIYAINLLQCCHGNYCVAMGTAVDSKGLFTEHYYYYYIYTFDTVVSSHDKPITWSK